MKLIVRDIEKVRTFYEEALGFEFLRHVDIGDRAVEDVLVVPGHKFQLILYAYKDGREISVSNGHGPFGFITADAAAAGDRIVAAGGTISIGPLDFNGMTILFAKDPEGHELEFIQRNA